MAWSWRFRKDMEGWKHRKLKNLNSGHVGKIFKKQSPYCWWFRNPANRLTNIAFTSIYRVSYMLGGARFLPSTVWNRHLGWSWLRSWKNSYKWLVDLLFFQTSLGDWRLEHAEHGIRSPLVGPLLHLTLGVSKRPKRVIHPERLTWNLRRHPWKRKIIFQSIISRFYVNLPRCTVGRRTLGSFPDISQVGRSSAHITLGPQGSPWKYEGSFYTPKIWVKL